MTFMIGTQPCVISVHELVEIVPYRQLLPVPSSAGHQPDEQSMQTLGILDYRGKAIPVFYLQFDPPMNAGSSISSVKQASHEKEHTLPIKSLLVLGKTGEHERTREPVSALAVSQVRAVVDIDRQSIQPPEEVGLKGQTGISGICRLNNDLAFVINSTALTPIPFSMTAEEVT